MLLKGDSGQLLCVLGSVIVRSERLHRHPFIHRRILELDVMIAVDRHGAEVAGRRRSADGVDERLRHFHLREDTAQIVEMLVVFGAAGHDLQHIHERFTNQKRHTRCAAVDQKQRAAILQ